MARSDSTKGDQNDVARYGPRAPVGALGDGEFGGRASGITRRPLWFNTAQSRCGQSVRAEAVHVRA